MRSSRSSVALHLMLLAGVACTGIASAQSGGPGGPPAPYVPPKMSMPKPFVPPPALSAVGRRGPSVPVYAIPPRTGSGLTRPLPSNFGGVRPQLPTSIYLPDVPTVSPAQRLSTVPRWNPGSFRGDRAAGVLLGDDRSPSAVRRGGRGDVTPDSGWYGHLGTSGASVGYQADGDGFSFRAHLGDAWLSTGRHCLWKQWGTCYPSSCWNGGWGWSSWDNGYSGYPIYSPIWPYPDPLLSMYYSPPAPTTQPDPATAGQAGPTLLEEAEILLSVERFADAAAAYREHLAQHADDSDALRMLGVALLMDRRPREAAEAILAAYRMNPALADSPVVLPRGLGPADLAVAGNRAIEYAQRTGSAPAWLTAAVMSQSRDKLPVARNFARSAKAAGLDPEVYVRLMSAWST